MIAASAIPVVIATIALAWVVSFVLVADLRRRPHLNERLRSVPSLMFWQVLTIAGVSAFVLLPYPLRWAMFLLAAARMLFEAIAIHDHLPGKGRTLALVLSPVLPLVLFAWHVGQDASAPTFLLSFLLTEAFDSFSLLGGRMFGARLMVPRLSPNKTWEGFLTGTALTLLIASALVAFNALTPRQAFLSTAMTVVFATVGDLAASYGKRLAGVKDYPVLIAGQGGLLDMFDSWIYAAPLTAFVLQLAAA